MADDLLNNVLGADYQEVNAVQSGNAVYKNGKLQYFKIDIDQPGKYFFDLTDAFNATVDESNKIIPLQFVRGGQPLQLNGFTISMDGKYPDMTTGFHVAGKLNTSSPAFVNFALPLGMFQAVGPYRFQFTITNSSTGETLKSPYQFFNVTESATNLAIDLNKGIEPYDSEYQTWKAKVENKINQELTTLNNLSESADQLKALMNQYVSDAEGYVESQFTKCLQKENTWTSKQHFNSGITADSADISNGLTVSGSISSNSSTTGNLTATGSVSLPNTTSFGDFKANQLLNAVSLPSNNNMLLNATGNANKPSDRNSKWWLWATRINIGCGVDFPMYIMHFDLTLDTSDVGKPIANFNTDMYVNNPGTSVAIFMNGQAGSINFHMDNSGNMYLDNVSGVSGKGHVRFTTTF